MDKIKSKKMVKNKLEYMVKNGIDKHKLIRNKRKHLLKYEKYIFMMIGVNIILIIYAIYLFF